MHRKSIKKFPFLFAWSTWTRPLLFPCFTGKRKCHEQEKRRYCGNSPLVVAFVLIPQCSRSLRPRFSDSVGGASLACRARATSLSRSGIIFGGVFVFSAKGQRGRHTRAKQQNYVQNNNLFLQLCLLRKKAVVESCFSCVLLPSLKKPRFRLRCRIYTFCFFPVLLLAG